MLRDVKNEDFIIVFILSRKALLRFSHVITIVKKRISHSIPYEGEHRWR